MIFLVFFSCQKETKKTEKNSAVYFEKTKLWSVQESKKTYTIEWLGKELNSSLQIEKQKLPLKKILVANPTAIAYLEELGLLDNLVGVRGGAFVYSQKLQSLLQKSPKLDFGSYENTELESIIKTKPDLVLASATQKHFSVYKSLENYNIPVLYFNDYEENDLLARLEHIKIFGLLFAKEELSKSLYEKRKKDYHEVLAKTTQIKKDKKPMVFFNCLYGDIWYMPGKNSFMTSSVLSLGGEYPWENDERAALPLSFEEVFLKAKDAEIWLNVSDFRSRSELAKNDARYSWFHAYKNKKMYSIKKRTRQNGANDFFEKALVRPDLLIKDLAAILYPEEFSERELYFYTQLQ